MTEQNIFGAFFNHHKDTDPCPFELPWAEFVALLAEPQVREEKFAVSQHDEAVAPGYSLARFVERDGQAAMRRNGFVDVLSGFVLDFDKDFSIDAVIDALEGVAWAAHTTWQHAPSAPRWRVIVPVSIPVAAVRYKAARAWLATRFGANKLDPAASALSNFYYLPCCPPGNEGLYELRVGEGPFLELPAMRSEFVRGLPPPRIVGATIDWPWLEARMKAHKDPDLRRAFRAVLKGEPFAEHGSRDTLLTRMCGALAGWATGCDPGSLAQPFAASLAAMAARDPLDPPPDLANAADKIRRAQSGLANQARQENQTLADDAATLETLAPEAEAVLEEAALAVGLPDAEALRRRLLLRYNNSVWCWDMQRREWRGPLTDFAALLYAQRDLARVPGVTVWTRTNAGGVRLRTLGELFYEYGEVIRSFAADLTVSSQSYDEGEQHLRLVGSPRRSLTPEFHPVIDKWLRALGGAEPEKLLDWLAALPDLSKPNSVLFIRGATNAGKGLLLKGAARLWMAELPTDMRDYVKEHGGPLLQKCPLLQIDEGKWDRYADVTTLLRELTMQSSRMINPKHLAHMELTGFVRIIVTANNFNLFAALQDQPTLNPHDRDAIAKRFFEVEPSGEAAEILASVGGFDECDALAKSGAIARHILWLAETRKIHGGEKLVVEGTPGGQFASRIITQDRRYGTWVVEWLARYLSEPLAVEKEQGKLLWRGAGRVIVNPGAVVNTFDRVLKNKQRPQSLEISNALRSLSTGDLVPFPDKGKLTGFDVMVEVVAAWAEEHGIGDPSLIRASANMPRAIAGEAKAPEPAPPKNGGVVALRGRAKK